MNRHPKEKAEQHHADGLNINNMIAEYTAKGYKKQQLETMLSSLASINETQPDPKRYGSNDISNDLAQQSHKLTAIRKMFEANVPGLIKERFNHNPFEFYKYVSDPGNEKSVKEMFLNAKNYTFTRYED